MLCVWWVGVLQQGGRQAGCVEKLLVGEASEQGAAGRRLGGPRPRSRRAHAGRCCWVVERAVGGRHGARTRPHQSHPAMTHKEAVVGCGAAFWQPHPTPGACQGHRRGARWQGSPASRPRQPRGTPRRVSPLAAAGPPAETHCQSRAAAGGAGARAALWQKAEIALPCHRDPAPATQQAPTNPQDRQRGGRGVRRASHLRCFADSRLAPQNRALGGAGEAESV